jgi:diguanylate cyclase (GGDEF)-like protein
MQLQYDYYKILQVHNLAEPEIIESAYKRLARKYHPDVNPNADADEMMQMLNEAYTILSDQGKRKEYNREWEIINQKPAKQESDSWETHGRNDKMFVSAKLLLDEYFKNIKEKNYGQCYELISNLDKCNISKEEFINWQDAVSKIYRMTDYHCEFYGVYRDLPLNGRLYHDVVEFYINTVEYNIIMEMVQKDSFRKLILLEEGDWHVYIGYEKLQPIISKFKDLKGLLNAKSVMNELMENHNKVDVATGLFNQRGVMEFIEREIQRFHRYGNPFSLILCEIDLVKLMNVKEEKEIIDGVIKAVSELLIGHLRKLDLVGRWSENSILILLPETGLIQAIKVSHKIQKILKDKHLILDDMICKMKMDTGIAEYAVSLEETLDRIYNQVR